MFTQVRTFVADMVRIMSIYKGGFLAFPRFFLLNFILSFYLAHLNFRGLPPRGAKVGQLENVHKSESNFWAHYSEDSR